MPPERRARVSSSRRRLPITEAAAAGPCCRGWLSLSWLRLRLRPSKRPRLLVDSSSRGGAEEEGTPLLDDILVSTFAGLPEIADLVRVSATCRRWRRLVSSKAAFICRTPRQPGRYLRCLALGFFYQDPAGGAPRFAPTASATRLLGFRQTSLNTLVEDLDDGLFDRSCLVASRNGLLVIDLRGGRHKGTLRLCVCNPMTGNTNILPPLTGKEGVGYYACTVLTADDHDHDHENSHPQPSSSAYRLLLVYNRRDFTATRSYSSEEGRWSPEVEITNARVGKKQMGMTRAGAVIRGGKVVYWIAGNNVFGLQVDTSEVALLSLPWGRSPFPLNIIVMNTLLGVSPDGSLCAIQIAEFCQVATAERPRSIGLRVYTLAAPSDGGHNWMRKELIQIEQFLPAEVTMVRMRWFCEKSGVVLFTAGYSDQRSEVYALSLETQEVEKVASHDGAGVVLTAIDPWRNLHGYEMDRAAYLATLGEGDAEEEE